MTDHTDSPREVIGASVTLQIDPYPGKNDTCPTCDAPASEYLKHPTLKGGRCGRCGEIWLPGLTFGDEEPVYRDQISVERTADGGAIVRFDREEER
jgi:hypothetical protein